MPPYTIEEKYKVVFYAKFKIMCILHDGSIKRVKNKGKGHILTLIIEILNKIAKQIKATHNSQW